MFLFEIAIPSFNREIIIKERTLKLLELYQFNKKRIRIFVQSKEMRQKYIDSIGDEYNFEITGCSGICETRNFLRSYYHESADPLFKGVLFMDDDIEQFNELSDSGELLPVKDFDRCLEDMFVEVQRRGLRLFGPSAYNNNFYMKNKISQNLKYIVGAFCGLIIDSNKDLIHCDVDHGEDFQFTMEHFLADGGVVRFEKFSIKTKYFEQVGGICESLGGLALRKVNMEVNCKYLVDRYNGMCILKIKSYGYDIRLNYRYKNEIS
tara:strand:+ start:576 stop:1367 length:792 start_codon:yes stop_codon:yes gene_type:complete